MNGIDLNCDVGEIPELVADGSQAELLRYISSANVACDGHAGNAEMMRATILQAQAAGAAIGAHPGYEDRANFGRIELQLSQEEIAASVHRQILALDEIAISCSTRIVHVKPHGALYNQAARDRKIARAIAEGIARWSRGKDVILIGLAGSVMIDDFREAGFRVAAEAFADRRYESDGSLRSRKFDDAMLRTPEEAADQALAIVQKGCVLSTDGHSVSLRADTICIHGDTPGALGIAQGIEKAFQAAGIVRKRLMLDELR
jgi:5-oxoprolinase (ATP-hydrolysing) subunit A